MSIWWNITLNKRNNNLRVEAVARSDGKKKTCCSLKAYLKHLANVQFTLTQFHLFHFCVRLGWQNSSISCAAKVTVDLPCLQDMCNYNFDMYVVRDVRDTLCHIPHDEKQLFVLRTNRMACGGFLCIYVKSSTTLNFFIVLYHLLFSVGWAQLNWTCFCLPYALVFTCIIRESGAGLCRY